jgi:hypothetical protein
MLCIARIAQSAIIQATLAVMETIPPVVSLAVSVLRAIKMDIAMHGSQTPT